MRKWIALLCAVLLMSLTACQPTSHDTVVTTTSTTENTTTTATTTTLEDVLDYIEDNTTATENPDGSTTYTWKSTTEKPTIPTTTSTATTRKTSTRKQTTATKSKSTTVITQTTTRPAPIPTIPSTNTTTTAASDEQTTTTTNKKFSYEYVSNQTHTVVPMEKRYYYSLLDEEWKNCYRQIDKAVRNVEASITFDFDVTTDRKYYIYYLYLMDTPELFYAAYSVTLDVGGDGTSGVVFSYAVGNKEGEYTNYNYKLDDALRAKILKKKEKFDNAVAAFISTIPANVPDVVKERMIYDKLLLESQYNLPAANGDPNAVGGRWDGLANDNWTAYGIIINHTGVCESYSEAFQMLCQAVGIPCTRINNAAHMWNAVYINGEWYQCDITFDDPIGGAPDDAYHMFFNLTDKQIQESRTWLAGPYTTEGYFANLCYPVCTAEADSWGNFVKQYGE